MHQFYTLSAAALLATSALAAPAPKPPADVGDNIAAKLGHFSAAVHGHKHKGKLPPLAEMKHIFGKYNWKFDTSKFDIDIPHIDIPKGPPGKDKSKSYGPPSAPGKKAGLTLDLSAAVSEKADLVSGLVDGITDTIGSILGAHDDQGSYKDDGEDDKDDGEDDGDDDGDDDKAPGYGEEPKTTLSPTVKPTASKKPKNKSTGAASVSPVKPSRTPSSAAPAPPAYTPETSSSAAPAPPASTPESSSSAAAVPTTSSESYPEPSTEAPVTSEAPATSTSTYVEPTSAAPQPSSEPASTSSTSEVTYAPSFSFAPTTTATTVESSAAPVTSTPEVAPPAPVTTSSEAPATTTAPPATTTAPATTAPASTTSSVEVVPSSTKKAGNAKVTAAAQENEKAYLSPVNIGGQTLDLNFDTGSADLWVFSTSLPTDQRANHTAFDPSKSSTWQPLNGETWSIAYGDGSNASGTVGYDKVIIGAATATQQAVEIATAVSSKFASDSQNDGLVGLSFGSINTVRPTQQKTFFENIQAELDAPLFTADLREDNEVSTYEFGVIDSSKYKGEIHYTPVDSSRGHWEFASTTYSIGGQTYTNANAHPAIADTGTSLILADQAVVTAYYGAISGAGFLDTVGGYVYDCSAKLPDFGLQIGSSGFTAVIPGANMTYAPLGNGQCFGGLQSNGGGDYQILGDILFKRFFAVFNGGEKKFGVASKY